MRGRRTRARTVEGVRIDVLVVGAGPAGVAAALTARERGLRTVLADKASFPRDKTCGDGLTAQALRLLEHLGVEVPALDDAQRVSETVLVSPNGRRVTLPMPDRGIHSAVVPRRQLDAALLARARAAGVDVREASPIVELDETVDGVLATIADDQVEAAHVVAADGHWSAVRRLREPAASADLGTWHAFRQYFSGVDDPRQWVLFEEDLLPGYAWVFPLPGGRANVGFGVLRGAGDHREASQGALAGSPRATSLRSVLGPRAVPEATHKAWPIPASFDPDRLTGGPVLYTGDAAGVVDPMTGEGIAQALETGILAAEAIAAGGGAGARGPAVPEHGRRPARARPALRGAAPAGPASPPRGTRRDQGRRPDPVDAPQLRSLDVRGLPASGRPHS